MKNLIIASTSTIHGGSYLDYLLPNLKIHFADCQSILFIPYARPSGISHEAYTQKVASVFNSIGISVKGIHEFSNPIEAIEQAEGIFTGGGNTFLLESGRRGSNSRQPAWKAGALPTELLPHFVSANIDKKNYLKAYLNCNGFILKLLYL
jgi:dipeptidase E